MNLLIERFNYAPDGTFGRLHMPSGEVCFTCEKAWRGNTVGASCIPEGVYDLALRESPVVKRTSGGEFTHGYEITGVPGRTFIMLHPANWPHELEGCISPGMDYRIMRGNQGVTSSRDAFREMMAELEGVEDIQLTIRQYRPEWP